MEKFIKGFEKLLDFRNVLFLWSIVLFSDVFSLFFFHSSIKNINYDYLTELFKKITFNDLVFFVILFSVSYILIIPSIRYLLVVFCLWLKQIIYKWDWLYKIFNKDSVDIDKTNYCIYSINLKEYAMLHNNMVIYDIYKKHKYDVNKSDEFNIIALFVVIFSGLDYLLSKLYNNGICIINVIANSLLPDNIIAYFILGYIFLMATLTIMAIKEYADYYSDHIVLSREIIKYIRKDIDKFNDEANTVPPNSGKFII